MKTNEQIYTGLMRLRANEPKRYFFLRLRDKYDMIVTAFEKKNKSLVCERANDLSDWIRERSGLYGITAPEVKQYFVTNNLTLNFKF